MGNDPKSLNRHKVLDKWWPDADSKNKNIVTKVYIYDTLLKQIFILIKTEV